MSKLAHLLLALATVFICVLPAPAHTQSLTEALAEAYSSNNALRAARAAQRATEEGVPIARAAGYPNLSVNLSYGYTDRETNTPITPTRPNAPNTLSSQSELYPWSVSLNLQQALYQGGAIRNDIRRAKALAEAGQFSLIETEQQVLLNAVRAYFSVVRETEVVALRRANIIIMQQSLARARAQLAVGEVTVTDVAQAHSRLEGAHANMVAAQGALVGAEATYQEVIGTPPGDLFLPLLPPLPAAQDELWELTLRYNPRLGDAQMRERAAKYAVSTARATLLPSLTLNGAYTYSENNSLKGDDSEILSATVRARLPLYQGGIGYARTRQAKQQLQQAQWNLQHTLRQLNRQVVNAWQRLLTARAQIQRAHAQIQAQERALAGVRREAELGARTTLDVLDAEREYLDAQLSLATAQHDEHIASYTILALIGELTAQQLELSVDLYDQEEHYTRVRRKWIGLGTPAEEIVP